MTASQRMHTQVGLVALVVWGLAGAGFLLAPAKSGWGIAAATMAAIWIVVALIGRNRPFAEQNASERGFLAASVLAAGAMLVAALAKQLAAAFGLDGGAVFDRALGVSMGVVLVFLGNAIPKILGPITASRCAPAQVQSIQRLAGWAFVVAGLVSIAASLFLPVDAGQFWSMIAVAAALLVVALRFALVFLGPSARSSPTGT